MQKGQTNLSNRIPMLRLNTGRQEQYMDFSQSLEQKNKRIKWLFEEEKEKDKNLFHRI